MSNEPAPTPSPSPTPSETPTPESAAPASLVEGQTPPAQVPAQTDPAAPPQPAQPAAFTPLTVESFTIPEGFEVNDADRDAFLGVLNDQNLSRAELAQKLVDLQSGMAKSAAEAQEKAWVDAQEAWANETRNDKDIGGEKLAPALGKISQLIDKYGTPELRGIFTMTNAGNNVHMVKFLAKIAEDLTEAGPVSGQPAQPGMSLAKQLFPSMK